MSSSRPIDQTELEILQHESFRYFPHETNPDNGLAKDKTAADWPAGIAAAGFALAAYPVLRNQKEDGFNDLPAALKKALESDTVPESTAIDAYDILKQMKVKS